jgi:undecaprenyl-diphosphatase
MALFVVVGNFQWRTKVTAVVAASVLVALIGLSRMYLGLHFLSDVLGAMAAGGAWLALCVAGVEIYRRKEARTR